MPTMIATVITYFVMGLILGFGYFIHDDPSTAAPHRDRSSCVIWWNGNYNPCSEFKMRADA